jgi:hypothetical protein
VAHTYNPSYAAQREGGGGSWFEASPRQIIPKTHLKKYPTQIRAGGVTQVVECLPNKYEALSSNLGTAKKKKKKPRVIFQRKEVREKNYKKRKYVKNKDKK